jgi:hypothetical protein
VSVSRTRSCVSQGWRCSLWARAARAPSGSSREYQARGEAEEVVQLGECHLSGQLVGMVRVGAEPLVDLAQELAGVDVGPAGGLRGDRGQRREGF